METRYDKELHQFDIQGNLIDFDCKIYYEKRNGKDGRDPVALTQDEWEKVKDNVLYRGSRTVDPFKDSSGDDHIVDQFFESVEKGKEGPLLPKLKNIISEGKSFSLSTRRNHSIHGMKQLCHALISTLDDAQHDKMITSLGALYGKNLEEKTLIEKYLDSNSKFFYSLTSSEFDERFGDIPKNIRKSFAHMHYLDNNMNIQAKDESIYYGFHGEASQNTSDVSLHTIDAINNDSSYRNVLFDFLITDPKGNIQSTKHKSNFNYDELQEKQK